MHEPTTNEQAQEDPTLMEAMNKELLAALQANDTWKVVDSIR